MFTVTFTYENFANDRYAFAERARVALQFVLAKPEFLQRVRDAKYTATLFDVPHGSQGPIGAAGVAPKILAGVGGGGSPSPDDPHTVALTLRLAYLEAGSDAATRAHSTLSQIEPSFVDDCMRRDDVGLLAAVLMHEWMHSLGFVHQDPRVVDRGDVPYAIEGIVVALGPAARIPKQRLLESTIGVPWKHGLIADRLVHVR